MSNAGLSRAAVGVQMLSDANSVAQTVQSIGELNLTLTDFYLYQNFDDLLAADANTIFADSTDPSAAGQVAVDQAKKEIDSSRSDQANGQMNVVIEQDKQQLAVLSDNMTQVYSIMDPVKQLLSFFTGVIAQRL